MLGLLSMALSAHGQKAEQAPSAEQSSAGGARAREFQGDDLGQVLRLLARQAKIDVAVDENVKGLVSLRLENMTARDAIDVLIRQAKLSVTKDDKGVLYIAPPDAALTAVALLSKPEIVNAIAAYKHNLYAALMKEGFSADEALRIVLATDMSKTMQALDKKANPPAPK